MVSGVTSAGAKFARVTPVERFDPQSAWKLTDLASSCPTPGFDAPHRLDPYWDGLWAPGSAGAWVSRGLAERQVRAGLATLPRQLSTDAETGLAAFIRPHDWQSRLRLLGAVDMWRTVSAEQAAAITGDPTHARALSSGPASAFTSGLLDLGVFVNGLASTELDGRGTMYRPSNTDVFDKNLAPHLTMPEWVRVTGGQPWGAGGQYDRHNLLATELGLRFAEYTEVGTVLGEKVSTVDLLAGSGIGFEPILNDQRSADLTVVRRDGMRVAVELTANPSSQHFFNKVRRWAQLLASRPMDYSGLCVVFVVAHDPDRADERGRRKATTYRARTYQAIKAACAEFPGSSTDRVAARMGVATWREWFPGEGLVSEAFLTMRADRPTGPADAVWEVADFLEPHSVRFEAHADFDATAIMTNASLLAGVPHWLRTPQTAPALWPMLLRGASLERIPVPTPVRPNRVKGKPLGASAGAVGPAQPPKRLLAH